MKISTRTAQRQNCGEILQKHFWRRSLWLSLTAALILLPGTLTTFLNTPAVHASNLDVSPAQYVSPFIGTRPAAENLHLGVAFDSGNVFPGATAPQGMMQWSPDTTIAAGGYHYDNSTIHGFSLTHYSGRGCSAYQDFPFLPVVGSIAPTTFAFSTYQQPFSHLNETASPGYYRVFLSNAKIQVELTATQRAGVARFTFPTNNHTSAGLLINAGGSVRGDAANGTSIQIMNAREISGEATSGDFCQVGANHYRVFFDAQFDHPFLTTSVWQDTLLKVGGKSCAGNKCGSYVTFTTTPSPVVQVKIGLSFVSVDNARLNLDREIGGQTFDAIHARTLASWDRKLSQIQVLGGTDAQKTIFYTALYHALIHPNVFSDVNGEFMGFDNKVHVALGYVQYENISSWDMYRSLIPLLALLEPMDTSDIVQSLLVDAEQDAGGLPRWEVANDNSGGMFGDPVDPLIASAYALGARHFSTYQTLSAMVYGASHPEATSGHHQVRPCLSEYMQLGYIPAIPCFGSAATTLEYSLDNSALARFAAALGQPGLATIYDQRSQNWKNLYNPAIGYIAPRLNDGTFQTNFAPTNGGGFVEGDSAQYTWDVPPAQYADLFALMGGTDVAVNCLDDFFQELNGGINSPYVFMGNEPSFEAPWIYDFAGRPDRTQDVVQRIEAQLFKATP